MTEESDTYPTILYCLICDCGMREFYTMFFMTDDGRKRYGSICIDCRDQIKMDESSNSL